MTMKKVTRRITREDYNAVKEMESSEAHFAKIAALSAEVKVNEGKILVQNNSAMFYTVGTVLGSTCTIGGMGALSFWTIKKLLDLKNLVR